MLYALCLMLYALCFMPYALCFMPYALCLMLYNITKPFSLRLIAYSFMLYALYLQFIVFSLRLTTNGLQPIA